MQSWNVADVVEVEAEKRLVCKAWRESAILKSQILDLHRYNGIICMTLLK